MKMAEFIAMTDLTKFFGQTMFFTLFHSKTDLQLTC